MHFGTLPGPSTTLEGLHGTGACSYITLETALSPGLRDGTQNGLRVALSSGAAHGRRTLACQPQSVGSGRRLCGCGSRKAGHEVSSVRSR